MRVTRSGTTPTRRSGYLRAEPSRFFGREAELGWLDAGRELVAIVGPAGIGKTRLALRYGITRHDRFESVWFCDLRDATNISDMIAIVRRTLSSDPTASADPIGVERALAARPRSLVIIDNVEQLLPEAATTLRRWVEAAPYVRFIVTSREGLGVGEEVIELGPLRLPSEESMGEAVDLFVERVKTLRGTWLPRSEELLSIGQMVSRLGGVPLAIELAAAHAEEDPAEPISEWVPDTRRPPDPRRSIDRAFSLLPAHEREALCQCTVFRGSFTLQTATRVVRVSGHARTDELITTLARKSLLEVTSHDPLRFEMCEGIRSYAAMVLAGSYDASTVEWRHAEVYFERAASLVADPTVITPDVFDERDELRAAMALAAKAGHWAIVLRIAIALDALSSGVGLVSSELLHLDAALAAGAAKDLGLVGRALGVRASALFGLGRLVEARRDSEMALRLATELSDHAQICAMARSLGQICFQSGALDDAITNLQHALSIAKELDAPSSMASVYYFLASVHQSQGSPGLAKDAFESSLAIATRIDDRIIQARAHMGLAWAPLEAGDHRRAKAHYERALELAAPLRATRIERIVTGYLGIMYFDAGSLFEAEDHLSRGAFESRRAGDARVEGIFEGIRGGVLAALDRIEDAAWSLDLADDLLIDNPFYASVIAIHRGHLDLALARSSRARGDLPGMSGHVSKARERIVLAQAGDDPLVRRSDDARLAVKILRRAVDKLTLT